MKRLLSIGKRKLRSLSILLLIILLLTSVVLPYSYVGASGESWLANYTYRRAITVAGSPEGALTDIGQKITIHRSSGTSYSDHVYIGTNCKKDFSDIRFTTSDGSTELAYWLEPYRDAYQTDAYAAHTIYGVTWRMQSFKADHTGTVNGVNLWFMEVGSPTNLVVSLRTSPTGADVASVTIADPSTIMGTVTAVETFMEFATPYAVTSGTTYYILAHCTGDANNYIVFGGDTSTPLYPDGNLLHSGNSGVSFTAYTTEEHLFEVVYDTAIFSVKLDSIAIAPDTTTFYMYYGYSSAVSTSDLSTACFWGEDMTSAVSGTLFSAATEFLPFVRLNPATAGTAGYISYTPANPPEQYDVTWLYWTGGGSNGADAMFLSTDADSLSTSHAAADGGYKFVLNEYGNLIELRYNGTLLTSFAQSTLDDSSLHKVRCQVLTDGSIRRLRLWYDGRLVIEWDTSQVDGQYFYFGSWSGGAYNNHVLGWFYATKTSAYTPIITNWGAEETGVVPTVVLQAASNFTSSTARLNGTVTVAGTDNPTVTVYWGDNDGGTTPANWDHSSAPTSPAQPQGAATFYYDATGLVAGTSYYFTAKATNSYGTSWPSTSAYLVIGSGGGGGNVAKINGIAIGGIAGISGIAP